jgi:hypothetical protein
MSTSDTLLSARIEDRRVADFLFAADRRRHERRAAEHYASVLREAFEQ